MFCPDNTHRPPASPPPSPMHPPLATVLNEPMSLHILTSLFVSFFLANRETALVHAITMAGAMYSVVRNCSLGRLENCKCQPSANFKKARSSSSDWHWGGCSDNMAFGDQITRHFIDALEGREGAGFDARRQMNLHNNKVGRKVRGNKYFSI